jgi:hypothetical protein
MKIILSRKGFDSSNGGTPSPIFPDGRMVSLPIPLGKNEHSKTRYLDIKFKWDKFDLGSIVENLTSKCASDYTHFDPDLNRNSKVRETDWLPLFGQSNAAAGHLRNQDVKEGDVFLFFGRFRRVEHNQGKLMWNKNSPPPIYVIWGWLQISEILQGDNLTKYKWAKDHPHFRIRSAFKNDTIYISEKNLKLHGVDTKGLPGAGVFPIFSKKLQLTAQLAETPSKWALPAWFYPNNGKPSLTYHKNMKRWHEPKQGTKLLELDMAPIGQEFVLDCDKYPEAIEWFKRLLKAL